jgi:hypothetical protein
MAIETVLSLAGKVVVERALRSSQLDKKVLRALGREPVERAFQRALERAAQTLEREHPRWTAALFDRSFFEREAAPVLADLLVGARPADPSRLALQWASSISRSQGMRQTLRARELEPVAARFLEDLETELRREPSLAELNRGRALESSADALEALRRRLDAEAATPGTLWDYAHWLVGRTAYLDPRGLPDAPAPVELKLDDVYVRLRGHAEPGFTKAVDRPLDPVPDEVVTKSATAVDSAEFEALLERDQNVVVLGDPGSGKSTLLRHLAHGAAERVLQDMPDETVRLPILVGVAEYTKGDTWRNVPLSRFLVQYHGVRECPVAGLRDLFEQRLEGGSCLVLLDGLDEVVHADDRREVARRIEDFVRRHSEKPNRFVVTSRVAGYRDAPVLAPFEHYRLEDMAPQQVERFLQRWCAAVEDARQPDAPPEVRSAEAERQRSGLLAAIDTNPGVRRLAVNPLLLTILAVIHRQGARLPQRRAELYKVAATTLARTWRTAQGVPESALLQDDYLDRVLARLAYWLQLEEPTGVARERDVRVLMGEELARLRGDEWDPDDPHPEVLAHVDRFLRAVRIQTGLFVERAPRQYGFMHQTFQEYYAARHIERVGRRAPALIRRHLHDARWDEPLLLALGLRGLDHPEEASEMVEHAILAEGELAAREGFAPSAHEQYLARDFLFALRCLGDDIPVEVALRRGVVERAVRELVEPGTIGRFERNRRELEQALISLKNTAAGGVAVESLAHRVAMLGEGDAVVRAGRALLALEPGCAVALDSLAGVLDAADAELVAEATELLVNNATAVAEHAELRAAFEQRAPRSLPAALVLLATNASSDEIVRRLEADLRAWDGWEPVLTVARHMPLTEALASLWIELLGRAPETLVLLIHRLQKDAEEHQALAAELQRLAAAPPSVGLAVQLYWAAKRVGRYEDLNVVLEDEAQAFAKFIGHATRDIKEGDADQRATAYMWLNKAVIDARDNPDIQEQLLALALRGSRDEVGDIRDTAWSTIRFLGAIPDDDIEGYLAYLIKGASIYRAPQLGAGQLERVAEAARAPSFFARVGAATVLAYFEDHPAAAEALTALASDPDPQVRGMLVYSMRSSRSELAQELVSRAFADSDPGVREAAASAAGESRLEALEPLVIRALDDTGAEVRASAAGSLVKYGRHPARADDVLRATVADASARSRVREEAARVLGDADSRVPDTVTVLVAAAREGPDDLAKESIKSVMRLVTREPSLAERVERGLVAILEDAEMVGAATADHALETLHMLLSSVTVRD